MTERANPYESLDLGRYLRPGLPPLPTAMADLPVHRGYPVPWFVHTMPDGTPDFRIIDSHKMPVAIKQHRCWVCGKPIPVNPGSGAKQRRTYAFNIGPASAISRVSAEPPAHSLCADFSATACPFLTRPHMVRREAGLPEEARNDHPGHILTNPGVALVWLTNEYEVIPYAGVIGFGRPTIVRAFCEGRVAKRTEVREAFNRSLASRPRAPSSRLESPEYFYRYNSPEKPHEERQVRNDQRPRPDELKAAYDQGRSAALEGRGRTPPIIWQGREQYDPIRRDYWEMGYDDELEKKAVAHTEQQIAENKAERERRERRNIAYQRGRAEYAQAYMDAERKSWFPEPGPIIYQGLLDSWPPAEWESLREQYVAGWNDSKARRKPWPAKPPLVPLRCQALRDSHGVPRQCRLPAGHEGQHEAQGSAALMRWGTPEPKPTERSAEDLLHELEMHQANTRELARLTHFMSAGRAHPAPAGSSSVTAAIESIKRYEIAEARRALAIDQIANATRGIEQRLIDIALYSKQL